MKYARVIVLCALILALPVAAAVEPFIEDGRIVATIVVGERAPATDVILGSEIATYLQRFATQASLGLAETTRDITLRHSSPLILIGTPDDNPLVQELLGAQRPAGPVLELREDRLIVSGGSAADVRVAAEAFIDGQTTLQGPSQPVREVPELITEEPEVVEEPEAPEQEAPRFVAEETEVIQEPEVVCEQERFCRGADVMVRQADCAEVVLTTCDGLCRDGECVFVEERRSFWQRVVSTFAFWR